MMDTPSSSVAESADAFNHKQESGNDGNINVPTPITTTTTPAEPKFHVKQRVFALDTSSGLWYEAVIRRSLFGVHYHKQVPIGLVCDEDEIQDIHTRAAEHPTFHYFVHYNKWRVNWDRWVSQDEIMEHTETSKRIADRYQEAHKQLQKDLKKVRGKTDGAKFLREWRKRMDHLANELKKEQEDLTSKNEQSGSSTSNNDGKDKEKDQPKDNTATKGEQDADTTKHSSKASPSSSTAGNKPSSNKKKKATSQSKNVWDDPVAVEQEYRLRLRGLESRNSAHPDQHKLALPFSLKKVMVEAWEIITQCQMVTNLPAKVTVRQGLDLYLKSKLDLLVNPNNKATTKKSDPEKESAATKEETTNKGDETTPTSPTKGSPGIVNKHEGNGEPSAASSETPEEAANREIEEKLQKRRQEWIDMVEGIAMFFDEALPFRLLYSQELAQYKVVESTFILPLTEAEITSNGGGSENPHDSAKTECLVGDHSDNVKTDNDAEASNDNVKKQDDNFEKVENMEIDDGVVEKMEDDGTNQESSEPVDNVTSQSEESTKENSTMEVEVQVVVSSQAGSGQNNTADALDDAKSPDETKSLSPKSTGSNKKRKGGTPKADDKTRPMLPSEVYGCEHLLRLFLKVPELLAEQQPKVSPLSTDEKQEMELEMLKAYENESKQILAKINDLIRFLHKHQSTMFADSYRKLNDAELREEQKWIRYMERKRKRALEEKHELQSEASSPTAKDDEVVEGESTDAGATENPGKLQKVV